MGAKGLKALVVDQRGKSAAAIADPKAFKEAVKAVVELVQQDHMSAEVMPKLGTAALVAPVNSLGAFPSYNARKGVLEGWEKISGEAMAELIQERGGKTTHMGCSQCAIHCSNEFVDAAGKYVTSSLEYETIWSMGGMTGVADLDTIARLDHLCDDLGVDTMSTGVAVAVAMDAGYRKFGDADAVDRNGGGDRQGDGLRKGPRERPGGGGQALQPRPGSRGQGPEHRCIRPRGDAGAMGSPTPPRPWAPITRPATS